MISALQRLDILIPNPFALHTCTSHYPSLLLEFINNDHLSVATLLDACKTGHRLQQGILEKDHKVYNSRKNLDSKSSPDILTRLKVAGEKKGEELLGQQGPKPDEFKNPDADLKAPYEAAASHANEVFDLTKSKDLTDEMSLIRKHVNSAKETYCRATAAHNHQEQSPTKSKKGFRIKSDQEDLALKAAREYAEPIENILLTRNVEEVKASYAYQISINFAFSVAFTQLCLIKACASREGIAPCLRIFDEGKSFTPLFMRTLPCCEDEND